MEGDGGERGRRDSPPGVTELGNVGVPSVYFDVFVCLFFYSVSFQITDPLVNLAEVERGPLVLRNQHGRPFA